MTDRQQVAVALSGGGHRAGLLGLGALLYLVDAPVPRAASLLQHAYALTMVNSHGLLGYPLREIPDIARFEDLVR
jgi:hypothetical protein